MILSAGDLDDIKNLSLGGILVLLVLKEVLPLIKSAMERKDAGGNGNGNGNGKSEALTEAAIRKTVQAENDRSVLYEIARTQQKQVELQDQVFELLKKAFENDAPPGCPLAHPNCSQHHAADAGGA